MSAFGIVFFSWWSPDSVSANNGDTSMVAAYNIAKAAALEWNEDAQLYQINSVDTYDANQNHGVDGLRRRWNVEFVVPGTTDHFNVVVDRNKVAARQAFTNPTLWTPFEGFPSLDVSQASKVARKQGLLPGRNIGLGIHYRLYYHEGVPVLSLLGENSEGKRAAIMYHIEDGTTAFSYGL